MSFPPPSPLEYISKREKHRFVILKAIVSLHVETRACVLIPDERTRIREFRRIKGENLRRIGRALDLFNLQRRHQPRNT